MGVRLDAGVFQYIWENEFLEPEVEDVAGDALLVLSFQVVYVEA